MDGDMQLLKEWDGIAHARGLDEWEAGRERSNVEQRARWQEGLEGLSNLAESEERHRLLVEFADGQDYSRRRRIVDEIAFREALQQGLARKNMTVTQLARAIGLKTGSALWNFINHRTQFLAYATASRVAKVLDFDLSAMSDGPLLPGAEEIASIEQQIQEVGAPVELRQLVSRLKKVVNAQAINAPTLPLAALQTELLMVKVHVDEEGPRGSTTLPTAMQEPLTGRMSSRDAGRRAFGVRIIGGAAEPAYKSGTVLICVPTTFAVATTPLHGRRVLTCVRTARESQWRSFNVEIRQVSLDPKTLQRELLPLGTNKDAIPLEVPEEVYQAPWRSRGFDVKVVGLVIGSVVSEEGPRS